MQGMQEHWGLYGIASHLLLRGVSSPSVLGKEAGI